jgi:hypothetical protein
LAKQQRETLTEATSSCGADSNRESHFGDSGDNETASDNFGRLNVAVAAALARISYDIGPLGITKARVGTMETYTCYFPKGYG